MDFRSLHCADGGLGRWAADGVASAGGVGALGMVLGYLQVVETQGRGSLNSHMLVWTVGDVRVVTWMAERAVHESRMWASCFAADARLCFIWSHIHKCMNTCWKDARGGKPGDFVGICGFGYGDGCCLRGKGARLLHPHFCLPPGQVGTEQLGRLQVLENCPFMASSNFVALVVGRCNYDRQWLDGVHDEESLG